MKRFLSLVALGLLSLSATSSYAQNRDIGARRLLLDDGAGNVLTIEYAGGSSGTFIFPSGSSTTIGLGSIAGQTLRWSGSAWTPSSALTNDGTNVAATGTLTASGAINTATGYTIGGAAPVGQYLRGNGTNFVASAIQSADLPTGAFILNQSSLQSPADFYISGTGTASIFAMPATSASGGYLTIAGQRVLHSAGSPQNIFVGALTGNLTNTGTQNEALGYNSLVNLTTGSGNAAIGTAALKSNTSGGSNIAIGNLSQWQNTTGSYNTGVGTETLYSNVAGFNNSALGDYALINTTSSYNTGVGNSALYSNFTGVRNTALGAGADVSTGNLSNATVIGFGAVVTASNSVQLGNGSVTLVNTSGAINSGTGFRVAGAAAANTFLKGNGTDFVSGTIAASDLPASVALLSGNNTWTGTNQFNSTVQVGSTGTPMSSIVSVTSTQDMASALDNGSVYIDIPVAGAALGDVVSVGYPDGIQGDGRSFTAWVQAADNVRLMFVNESGGAVDLPSATYRVAVMKF